MLQNNPALKSKIDQLWNKFWSGGISNPLTAIEQITYLLFMKRLDDLDLKQVQDAEWTKEPFTSRFDGFWVPPEHRDKSEKEQKPFKIKKRTLLRFYYRSMKVVIDLQPLLLSHKVYKFSPSISFNSNNCFTMPPWIFFKVASSVPSPTSLIKSFCKITSGFSYSISSKISSL